MNHATCSHVRRDSYIRVIWLIHMCDVNHSCIWHDSTRSYVWRDFLFVCGRTYDSYVRWDLFICVTGLFHMCDVPILVRMRGEIYFLRFFLMCGVAHMCSETLPDVWQDSFISVMWHYSLVWVTRFIEIYVDVWPCTYVRRDSFIRVTGLFHTCDTTLPVGLVRMCDEICFTVWHESYVRRDSFIWMIGLFHTCDVTLLVSMWQDSSKIIFMCGIALMFGETLSYVWQDSFICMMCDVILLVRMCGKNLLYVWQDSFVCVAWSCISVTWLIRMCEVTHYICDMTHSLVCVAGFICMCRLKHTGWRRLIGCLKLQVIVHKRATKYRALLRKMISKDKASYGSSPPCICDVTHSYVRRDASYLWYDLFIRVTWPIHMCSVTHLTLQRCGSF